MSLREAMSNAPKRSLISILIAKSKKNNQSFKTPMLTNTTLNIMRLYGKYIQMLSIFRIISSEVIAYLMQLFYFYFYYIYMHFAKESSEPHLTSLNGPPQTSIEAIIKNIKVDLFERSKYNMAEPMIASIKSMKNRQDYLSCIGERVVAAESLVFLAQQLENLFPLLNEYLPNGANKGLDGYLNILRETHKMRVPIYNHISKVSLNTFTIKPFYVNYRPERLKTLKIQIESDSNIIFLYYKKDCHRLQYNPRLYSSNQLGH